MNTGKIYVVVFIVFVLILSCGIFDSLVNSINTSGAVESGNNSGYSYAEYKNEPSKRECYEGELADSTKMIVLELVNNIRNLHGLNPVVYSYERDISVQSGALIIASNQSLSHFPPEDWKCWSREGADGCSVSNIFGGYGAVYTPAEAVIEWLIDTDVPGVGHRKWILNPFMKSIAYGHVMVDGFTGALLDVLGDDNEQSTEVDFVAYPFEDYPSEFFYAGWCLSFLALQSGEDMVHNIGIDYSSAEISITSETGKALNVNSIDYDNDPGGLLNHMTWKVKNIESGVKYNVTVKGIKTGNGIKDFEYWFRIK